MSKLYEKSAKNSTPSGAVPDAVPGSLIVSVVRYEDPVGKQYVLRNGMADRGETNHRSKRADGETLEFSSFEDFTIWRKALTSGHMLVSGTFEAVGEVPVVHKGEEGPGEVSATKTYLAHRNQPGILIIDIDYKDPNEVAGLYLGGEQPYKTLAEALGALRKVLPGLGGCALMIGWSTSSNLFDKEGKQVKGTGGLRIYIPVTDASKIPELLETIHRRSWLHGEGWAFVGVGGGLHERSLVDTALGRPAQPDFAAPDLRDGLTQDREWNEFTGEHLDPASVAPLTAEEEAEYQKAVAVAKDALAADMKAAREDWLGGQTDKAMERGVSPKRAMAAAIQRLDNGVLFPTDTIIFGDGTAARVLELLTDGSAHDGKTCKDPVEPDYNGGASVGVFSWNDGEGPGIHSFAHGSKWYALKHDAESLEVVIDEGIDNAVHLAFALTAFASKTEEARLEKSATKALGLGNSVKVFRADVAGVKNRFRSEGGEKGLDAAALSAINEGRWPTDTPLPSKIFPAKKGGSLLSHAENYKTMMSAYGYGCSYDVIKKDISWTGPQINMTTDNAYQVLFSKMKGLAALNGLPHGNQDLNAHLPAIAEENQINPVRDYLAALEWDGKDRIGLLVQAIESHDAQVAEIALRVWFTGAAAACEHFETGLGLVHGSRPSFEYVLALLGGQGVNKSKGFLGLIPKALAKYAKDGLSIKTANKDSVKIAVSYWLVELGELDVTFGQGQIAELKAFLSTEADELRLPYAQGYSKFKRRTAFIGTVNQDKFLKDATGNRRYLAIECTHGFPNWAEDEVDQLWAQAWARYEGGAQWWPTAAEQVVLDVNAERFLQYSWAETRIREVFDFTRLTESNKRLTATNLWAELCRGDGENAPIRELKPQQLNELRAAMKKLWNEHGAYKREGEQAVKTKNGDVNTCADSGKNKGWLVPMTAVEALGEENKYQRKAEEDAKEEVVQRERVKRVKIISAGVRADADAEGKKVSPANVFRQVLNVVEREFREGKGGKSKFPMDSWKTAFNEAEGLEGGIGCFS